MRVTITNQEILNFLMERLCPHEGGSPSVNVGYDDATFCYVITQNRGFGPDAKSETLGEARSLVTAFDLAITGRRTL